MTCYVDTSVWIALLGREKTSASVAAWMELGKPMVTAHWTAVEIASAMSIKARRGEMTQEAVSRVCSAYRDLVAIDGVTLYTCETSDFQEASLICEQVDLKIRGGDGLHLVVAQRVGCSHFLSFDKALNAQALQMGLELVTV